MTTDTETSPLRTQYATVPPQPRQSTRAQHPFVLRRPSTRILSLLATGAAGAALVIFALLNQDAAAQPAAAPTVPAALTIAVFLLTVWAWIATKLDDTLVAFLGAIALIAVGVLPAKSFFASLGDETIWLLIGAFLIAAGVSASGLALRGAAHLLTRARSPRALFHLTTLALALTTFAVPATSGRAALAIPVFAALSGALADRKALVRALSLLFPTVILLSAVGSFLGAGAHIITAQILQQSTGVGFSFLTWLWFGLPLAVVSSHLAAEIVLLRFTTRAERRQALRVTLEDLAATATTPVRGALTPIEKRAALLLIAVTALWCTEPWHGISPAFVALLGAVAAVTPVIGCTTLPVAVKRVPWSLLLFLAATLALASALTGTGAAAWLGQSALAPLAALGDSAGVAFVLVVIALSLGAHLLIPSRSARSAAIIPIVVLLAPGLGVNPAAAAFASTAAAGFCHTLPSSAKPVAMFADPEVAPGGFHPKDLRALSAILAPAMFVLIVSFSFWIWPAMGMPLLS